MCTILSVNTGLSIYKAKGTVPRADLPQVTGMTWKNEEDKCIRGNTGSQVFT